MTTISDLEKIGSQIVANIIDHEAEINFIANLSGVGVEVSYAEKALPYIKTTLDFLQQETGKSPIDVFKDWLSHNTPGKPNSPVLSPTATDTQATTG